MAKFTGVLVMIGDTSFLDNVLLVRNNDAATATSFLQNRGLSSGVVVITGSQVKINTTPAIEVDSAESAAAPALAAAESGVAERSVPKKRPAAKKRRGKGRKGTKA
jgi:hypothetical protein